MRCAAQLGCEQEDVQMVGDVLQLVAQLSGEVGESDVARVPAEMRPCDAELACSSDVDALLAALERSEALAAVLGDRVAERLG